MNAKLPCPSRDQLERLLLGDMTAEEMEALQGHVVGCLNCLQAIRSVTTEDALVQAVRAGAKAENSFLEEANQMLLARLRQLHPRVRSTLPRSLETLAPYPSKFEEGSGFLSAPEEPDELGRFGTYGILRSLGSGGMGVVFAARQAQPRRIVALKMLLGGWHGGKQRLARFRSETAIIAHLQHPNIVPVYEVGEQDGRPYYTMEYLDGGSLAQRLTSAVLAPTAAAELALVLAHAVHFAHEHGVVHRDLKPANVLLAGDGTPKVADFGLAKQLHNELEEPPSFQTESGAILGTPGYMAPEQVESKHEIGPAADVYALGAILYECLTGRPPFRAASVLETLEQVRTQEPAPISQLQPNVPRDLQTICMKCLHKETNGRYDTAAAFADELGRFLRGEPIRARPVSWRARLWKWARRKPTLAVLLGVCCLLMTTLIVGGLAYNARLRAAVEQAQNKEAETRRQYHQAHETLDRMLGRLEGQRLAEVPQLKELQRNLLEDALAFYHGILKQADSPDPAVRRDAAVACRRVADIQQILGQFDFAAENYRRAIELIEGLPTEDRDAPSTKSFQAACYMNWGVLANNLGQSEEAERYNRAAQDILERLAHEQPDDSGVQNQLAEVQHNRGNILARSAKRAEAESCYAQAASIRTVLVRDHPEEERYQLALSQDYATLGLLHRQAGRAAEASPIFEKAEARLRRLVDRHPAESKYTLPLVGLYVNWCYVLAGSGRTQEALERLDLAVRLAEAAILREPRDLGARSQTLAAHGARAEILEFLDRFADSIKDWDRVIELEEGPARNRWRGTRARVLTQAGDHARAVAEAGELVALPESTDDELFFLAHVYALAMRPARSDIRLPSAERERLVERYAVQAVALLRRLQSKGYFKDAEHAKALRNDDDLQPLRAREDFRRLLAAVGDK